MSRKSIDCRQIMGNGNGNCTLVISGSEAEVLDIAIIHAIVTHGYDDPYALRRQLQPLLLDAPASATAPA